MDPHIPPSPDEIPPFEFSQSLLSGIDPQQAYEGAFQTKLDSAGLSWEPPLPDVLSPLLPQYEITGLLGCGGMGAVYKARHRGLDRPVAIKLMSPALGWEPDFVERFIHEARALATLDHPNIVHVYDSGQTSAGHLYFVMEFVEGTDLQRVIHPKAQPADVPAGENPPPAAPSLTFPQIMEIIGQICDALQYAHKKGIVHRDIKPANVLLSTSGQVKVADFGLARRAEAEESQLTATGTVMGTPDYMAPEQRQGQTVDHRADIYSLGVMFYEMLTGSLPRGHFQPPSRKVVQLDIRLDEVVLKAMAEEPERRYQQANEIKNDVTRIHAGPDVPPAGAKETKSGFGKWIAAAAVLILLAAGGWWSATREDNATPEKSNPATAASKPLPDADAVAKANKLLAQARALFKAGETGPGRQALTEARAAAGDHPDVKADALLQYAAANDVETASRLAVEFTAQAEASHPQFAAVAELQAKLSPTLRAYAEKLAAAAKCVAAHDNEGELRALKAALELVPDGAEAASRQQKNPILVGRPLEGRAWTNELGQKFIPIPGAPPYVLYGVWETRVKDFEAFVKESGYKPSEGIDPSIVPPGQDPATLNWKNPGFAQTPDHPVVAVAWEDAYAFGDWLSKRERKAGRLLPGQTYRLPTDREWSRAVGMKDDDRFPWRRTTPEEINSWAGISPIPPGCENLCGREFGEKGAKDYEDAFVWTAPVGSGRPNSFGLFDTWGNVSEMIFDFSFPEEWEMQCRGLDCLRGPHDRDRQRQVSHHQDRNRNTAVVTGFRCVLDLKTEAQRAIQTQMEAGIEKCPADSRGWRVGFSCLVNDECVRLMNRNQNGSLTPFAKIPITELFWDGFFTEPKDWNGASHPDAVRRMPLKVLMMRRMFARDLSFLEQAPLEFLSLLAPDAEHIPGGHEFLKSLAPLAGKKLREILLQDFRGIEDLSPLADMPIESLQIPFCSRVSDLSPLRAAPAYDINLHDAGVTDPAWLSWWPKLRSIQWNFKERMVFEPYVNALVRKDFEAAEKELEEVRKRIGISPWGREFLQASVDRPGSGVATAELKNLATWATSDRQSDCPAVKTVNGHHYAMVAVGTTQQSAREMAAALGGHLVTITSKEENDFIGTNFVSKLEPEQTAWLGGSDAAEDGVWKWETGEPWDYQNFEPNQPSGKTEQNGLVFRRNKTPGQPDGWNDTKESEYFFPLIEWEPAR